MLGGRSRRLGIYYSCSIGGDVLIRHLMVAASCAVIDVDFSFFMESLEKTLYQKRRKRWRMKKPGRPR